MNKQFIISAFLFVILSLGMSAQEYCTLRPGMEIAFAPIEGYEDVPLDCFYSISQGKKRGVFMQGPGGYTLADEIYGHSFSVLDDQSRENYMLNYESVNLILLRDGIDTLSINFSHKLEERLPFSRDKKKKYSQLCVDSDKSWDVFDAYFIFDLNEYNREAEYLCQVLNRQITSSYNRPDFSSYRLLFHNKIPYVRICDKTRVESEQNCKEMSLAEMKSLRSDLLTKQGDYQSKARAFVNRISILSSVSDYKPEILGYTFNDSLEYTCVIKFDDTIHSFVLSKIENDYSRIDGLMPSLISRIKEPVEEFIEKNCSGDMLKFGVKGYSLHDTFNPKYYFSTSDDSVSEDLKDYFSNIGIPIATEESDELKSMRLFNDSHMNNDVWVIETAFNRNQGTFMKHDDGESINTEKVDFMYYGWYKTNSRSTPGIGIANMGSSFYHLRYLGIERTLQPDFEPSWEAKLPGVINDGPLCIYGNYYMVFGACPDEYYNTKSYEEGSMIGSRILDKIYIPFSEESVSYLYDDAMVDTISEERRQIAQELEDEFNDRYSAMYEGISMMYGREIAEIIVGGNVRFGFTSDMCKWALNGEPFTIQYNVSTPYGPAECLNFYTQQIKLLFIDDILIGMAWKGDSIKYHTR